MVNNKVLVVVMTLTMLILSATALSASTGNFSVYYDLEGLTTTAADTLAASVEGQGIKGLSLSRGIGIKAAGLTNGFSASGWNSAVPTREGALEAGTYFEFGMSVDPGFTASLLTLDLSLRRSATNGPMYYELQVSLDEFASPGITVTSFEYRGRTSGSAPAVDPLSADPYYYMHSDLAGRPNATTSPGDAIPTVDLSTIGELKGIPAGKVVTFRLYGWGNEKTTATNTVALGRVVGPLLKGLVVAD